MNSLWSVPTKIVIPPGRRYQPGRKPTEAVQYDAPKPKLKAHSNKNRFFVIKARLYWQSTVTNHGLSSGVDLDSSVVQSIHGTTEYDSYTVIPFTEKSEFYLDQTLKSC